MSGHGGSIGWAPAVVAALATGLHVAVGGKGKRFGGLVVAMSLLVIYPLAALASAGVLVLWLVGLLPGGCRRGPGRSRCRSPETSATSTP